MSGSRKNYLQSESEHAAALEAEAQAVRLRVARALEAAAQQPMASLGQQFASFNEEKLQRENRTRLQSKRVYSTVEEGSKPVHKNKTQKTGHDGTLPLSQDGFFQSSGRIDKYTRCLVNAKSGLYWPVGDELQQAITDKRVTIIKQRYLVDAQTGDFWPMDDSLKRAIKEGFVKITSARELVCAKFWPVTASFRQAIKEGRAVLKRIPQLVVTQTGELWPVDVELQQAIANEQVLTKAVYKSRAYKSQARVESSAALASQQTVAANFSSDLAESPLFPDANWVDLTKDLPLEDFLDLPDLSKVPELPPLSPWSFEWEEDKSGMNTLANQAGSLFTALSPPPFFAEPASTLPDPHFSTLAEDQTSVDFSDLPNLPPLAPLTPLSPRLSNEGSPFSFTFFAPNSALPNLPQSQENIAENDGDFGFPNSL